MTNVSGGVPTLRLMTRYRGARAVWPQLQDTIYSITYTQIFLLVFVFAFVLAFVLALVAVLAMMMALNLHSMN